MHKLDMAIYYNACALSFAINLIPATQVIKEGKELVIATLSVLVFISMVFSIQEIVGYFRKPNEGQNNDE